MAKPPKNYDLTLNSKSYALDVINKLDLSGSYHQRYPQPRFPEEDSDKFWMEWTMQSFHGGERLPRILKQEDLEQFRYHDAEGVDVANLVDWGEVELQPALSRSLAIQSASMPMTVSSTGATLVVGLDESPYIKLWTTSGWANASSVAGTGTVTDLLTAGTTLYGVRGGAVITSTNTGGTWSAVGSYTTAVGVAYVNGDLYVGKSDGVYNHTQDEAVTTIGCSAIAGYRENVYFSSDSRLYRYDGRATYLYDQLPQGFNITALIPYRQVLFILGYYKVRTGYKGAVYYLISGSENHLYSLGDYSADHRIYALAGGDDEVWVASPKRGGVDRYDLEAGGISAGPIWGAAGYVPFKGIAVCEGYLFVGRFVGSDGNATLGNSSTEGATWVSIAGNKIYASKFTLAGAASVDYISAYCTATAGSTYPAKMSIYNSAGAVVATSGEVAVDNGTTSSNFTFAETQSLAAGDYWLVFHVGAITGIGYIYGKGTGGTSVVLDSTYADGAPSTISVTPNNTYLYVMYAHMTETTDGIYIADIAAPSAYKTSGWLTTAEYDFNYPNATKLFRDIRIEHRSLVTGQSIAVAYSLNGGSSWTTATTSNKVAATSKSITLSNITGDSLKLKFTLASSGSNTPTLTKCVVRAAPVVESKWMWDLRLLLLKQWKTSVADLKTANDLGTQLTFVDVDGTSYSVVVQSMAIHALKDPDFFGAVALVRLREV